LAINTIIFGTDGWRGLIDSEININTVEEAAQAFAAYLFNKYGVENTIKTAVAFDGRKYSPDFAKAFASVLSGNGIHVSLSDAVTPTPALSFYVKDKNLNAGIMITASHNPPEYNGIKFKASYGGPFLTEETHLVEKELYKQPVIKNEELIVKTDMLDNYLKHIEGMIDFKSIESAGIRVLIDSMSGAGQDILEKLLRRRNIKANSIFSEARADFSGRLAEPIEKNLHPLKEALEAFGEYSFGAATDGDADRLGVLLDNGEWLSAQETILYLTDYIINVKKYAGNIVKTSSVTDKVFTFENEARKVFDVQVGFKYICETMIAEDVAIGCEESGGYGYKYHIPERDGIFSALLIAEMLAKAGCGKLSEYVEQKRKEFGHIYYDRIDRHYSKPDRIEKLPQMFNAPPSHIGGFEVLNITPYYSSRGIINGLKFFLRDKPRWLLLRSSETEPMIRIYSEGKSDDEVKTILNAGKELIS
jgi:phosphomannomutase